MNAPAERSPHPLSRRFATAFRLAWEETKDSEGGTAYRADSPRRTSTMLRSGDEQSLSDVESASVLQRTGNLYDEALIPLRASWYTVDLMLVRPTDINSPRLSVPAATRWRDYWRYMAEVLIEHENGDDVETEMWKLAHWRSPLKVLVFYDFPQDTLRERGQQKYSDTSLMGPITKGDWLPKKLDLLRKILSNAQDVLATGDGEYLLIVGSPERWEDGSPVK